MSFAVVNITKNSDSNKCGIPKIYFLLTFINDYELHRALNKSNNRYDDSSHHYYTFKCWVWKPPQTKRNLFQEFNSFLSKMETLKIWFSVNSTLLAKFKFLLIWITKVLLPSLVWTHALFLKILKNLNISLIRQKSQQIFVGLQDVLETSLRVVLRTSSTSLRRNNFTSWRRLGKQKIVTLKTSWIHVSKTSWTHVLKSSSRRLGDKQNVYWGHLSLTMSWYNKQLTGWQTTFSRLIGFQIEVTLSKERIQSSSFSLITRKMKFRKLWALIVRRPLKQQFKLP